MTRPLKPRELRRLRRLARELACPPRLVVPAPSPEELERFKRTWEASLNHTRPLILPG